MILSILLFFLGIVLHEVIHILQLRRVGIYRYQIQYFPPGIRFGYSILTGNPAKYSWEIIPSLVTIICWYLAYMLW